MKIHAKGWDCPICADDLYIETVASQDPRTEPDDENGPPDDGYAFWAWEGDVVGCERCGFRGVVDCDDGSALLKYDEESTENVAAWERNRAAGGGEG